MTVFAATARARRSIADLLDDLDDAQLATPSLCAGWSVKVVAGHVAAAVTVPARSGSCASCCASGATGTRPTPCSPAGSRELPTAELAALLREHADREFSPPVVGPRGPLSDGLIHEGDMRVPLGLPHAPDPADVALGLEFITAGRPVGFVPKGALRGLRLVATDLDRAWGDGDALEGRGIDLLMAACGRTALLPALTGAGVPVLAGTAHHPPMTGDEPPRRPREPARLPAGRPAAGHAGDGRDRAAGVHGRWVAGVVPAVARPIPRPGSPCTSSTSPRPTCVATARIAVGAEESHPFRVAPDVYEGLAADALGFFRRMRCAHPDTAVAAWTGPDAERLYPGWHPTGRFDVSGGWYDAGDYGKYVVSGSLPAWQLLDVAPQECRWQLDWMLRMLVPAGQPLAGMAFHRVHGTEWSPLPGLPHEDPTTRVLHRPSTAATLHVAAVAAAAARRSRGTPYAARLLAAARRAHAAAHRHPRLVAPDDEGRFGGGPYGDDRLDDDFYWAAAELWLATGERPFLAELMACRRPHRRRVRPRGVRLRPRRRARPASTSPSCRARCRTATGCGRASWRRASACWRCRPTSRGGSRTRRARAGTGARTGGS